MDLKIKEDIQFHALSVFSENLVKARYRLESMNAQIRDAITDTAIKANIHHNIRASIQEYNSFRIKLAKKKQEVLNALSAKYPLFRKEDILRCLNAAVNEYEKHEGHSNSQCIMTKTAFPTPTSSPVTKIMTNRIQATGKQTNIVAAPTILEKATVLIPVYKTPTRDDMAVLLVYFNALSYKKLAQNLCLIYHTLTRAGIPVYLVEHCFKDQTPLFPENGTTIFNTRSDSYMFYKENLLNWIMPKVPAHYTKFFMMDCDVLFDKEAWYDDVSVLLDTHDIVQPFDTASWLNSDLKTINLKRDGIVFANNTDRRLCLSKVHAGFAWAFRRKFIQPIGIFDENIIGSGDTILGSAILGKKLLNNDYENNAPEWMRNNSNIYCKSFKGTYTYYSQTLYHLWHGSRENRKYVDRYGDFKAAYNTDISDKDGLFVLNHYGLYEFKETIREQLNEVLLNYFKGRDEDGI